MLACKKMCNLRRPGASQREGPWACNCAIGLSDAQCASASATAWMSMAAVSSRSLPLGSNMYFLQHLLENLHFFGSLSPRGGASEGLVRGLAPFIFRTVGEAASVFRVSRRPLVHVGGTSVSAGIGLFVHTPGNFAWPNSLRKKIVHLKKIVQCGSPAG